MADSADAAGITAGDDKPRISQRVASWKFSYPAERDRDEHSAVQAAANFIRKHSECFPGGKIPSTPSQLAILAIKVYDVFLEKGEGSAKTGLASDTKTADAIVAACSSMRGGRLQ